MPQSSASLRLSSGSCVAAKLRPRSDALALLAGTNLRLAADALARRERADRGAQPALARGQLARGHGHHPHAALAHVVDEARALARLAHVDPAADRLRGPAHLRRLGCPRRSARVTAARGAADQLDLARCGRARRRRPCGGCACRARTSSTRGRAAGAGRRGAAASPSRGRGACRPEPARAHAPRAAAGSSARGCPRRAPTSRGRPRRRCHMSRASLRAAEAAQVLEPVGVEAVVGDALLRVVEGALAGLLAVEGDLAVVGLERVGDLRRRRRRAGATRPPRSAP